MGKYQEGQTIYNYNTGNFYKIISISNNGSIKAVDNSGRPFHTSFMDPSTVPGEKATF